MLRLNISITLLLTWCWFFILMRHFDFSTLFLKDPSDRRRVICDDKLKELFKVDNFNGFAVARHLKSHFIKTE